MRVALPMYRDSIQYLLRASLPPIKNDNPRLDFCTGYRREVAEYDIDYTKKYDESLNDRQILYVYHLFSLLI